MTVYTGEANGKTPILANSNAMAMVTNGADRALPIIVRCSTAIPNELTSKIAVRQYEGS